jgi:hypothetical protein
VVLCPKELTVLRPHGHILRTGGALTPDEAALTSTVWMGGVFHSMVTQGHVSINRFLSTTHSYLGLFRAHGQRIFIDTAEGWRRLDLPSAFEMNPESCRWIYRHGSGLLEVRSGAATDRHELTLDIVVLEGAPVRCLISHHVAMNGDDGAEAQPVIYERQGQAVFVRAVADSDVGRRFPEGGFRIEPQPGTALEQVGGDELLFTDGRSRQQPFLCLITESARALGLKITGHLVPAAAARSAHDDAEPWGSASTTRVRQPRRDAAAARYIAVVVLPTPPLVWIIAHITQRAYLHIAILQHTRASICLRVWTGAGASRRAYSCADLWRPTEIP